LPHLVPKDGKTLSFAQPDAARKPLALRGHAQRQRPNVIDPRQAAINIKIDRCRG